MEVAIISCLIFVLILHLIVLFLLIKNKPEKIKSDLLLALQSSAKEDREKLIEEILRSTTEKLHLNHVELIKEFGALKSQLLESHQKSDTVNRELHSEFRTELLTRYRDSQDQFQGRVKEMFDLLIKNLAVEHDKLLKTTDQKLDLISGKVDEKLDKGFEKTMVTFNSVIERLAKIDEAQKKIESLSSEVVDLQSILTDKKTRGIFGEVLLHQVIASIFGDKNDKLYKLQHSLTNGAARVIADAVIFMPEPLKMVAVDSKFPLENYRRMLDKTIPSEERSLAEKEFKSNVKKHVNDIASKYIIEGITAEMAVLFLPAESIFAELNAYHDDLLDYARSKKVWIASPTTLISFLTTLQAVMKDIETGKQASIIQQELKGLSAEFERFAKRWKDLAKHIKTVNEDVDKLDTTTEKISKKFKKIEEVEFDGIEPPSLETPEENEE